MADRSTAELMSRFYGYLKEGETHSEALRRAQIDLIRHPVTVYDDRGEGREIDVSHPYYWAAFQLNGE